MTLEESEAFENARETKRAAADAASKERKGKMTSMIDAGLALQEKAAQAAKNKADAEQLEAEEAAAHAEAVAAITKVDELPSAVDKLETLNTSKKKRRG